LVCGVVHVRAWRCFASDGTGKVQAAAPAAGGEAKAAPEPSAAFVPPVAAGATFSIGVKSQPAAEKKKAKIKAVGGEIKHKERAFKTPVFEK
jgi:hypothetical protein